jgi:hypothetical protein
MGGTAANSCASVPYGGDNANEGVLTHWEIKESDTNSPINNRIPITQINPNGTGQVWIEVYRLSGSPSTCNTYTLTISD